MKIGANLVYSDMQIAPKRLQWGRSSHGSDPPRRRASGASWSRILLVLILLFLLILYYVRARVAGQSECRKMCLRKSMFGLLISQDRQSFLSSCWSVVRLAINATVENKDSQAKVFPIMILQMGWICKNDSHFSADAVDFSVSNSWIFPHDLLRLCRECSIVPRGIWELVTTSTQMARRHSSAGVESVESWSIRELIEQNGINGCP